MTWFRVDDGFYDHPKTLALEDGPCFGDAVALWTLAGAWCGRQLTDGKITDRQVARLGFSKAAADELVRVGLWERAKSGYQFHDWAEHQPTRETVEARRKATSDRVARWRERRANEHEEADAHETHDDESHGNASLEPSCNAVTSPACNAVTNASANESVTPPPTRPVPTRPDPSRPEPLATLEGENARGRAAPTVVSSSHLQEFSELLRSEAYAAGYTASPRLIGTQLRDAADRAKETSDRTGVAYPEAARTLIRSALEAAKTTGKAVGLLLLDIEPSRPLPGRATATRTERARATTHEDFANAEPLDVQLERMATRERERCRP